jgi:four helix bundle protein
MGGTYRDLVAWQRAMELTIGVYGSTRKFPADEKYGLTSQLRRAAVSVARNIAEGKGRSSDRDLLYFLSCARGSLYEVQTQLELARLLGYLAEENAAHLISQSSEVSRLLSGLMTALRPTQTKVP